MNTALQQAPSRQSTQSGNFQRLTTEIAHLLRLSSRRERLARILRRTRKSRREQATARVAATALLCCSQNTSFTEYSADTLTLVVIDTVAHKTQDHLQERTRCLSAVLVDF